MEQFNIRTEKREVMQDITTQVQDIVTRSKIHKGLAIVYIPHTTAAVTINENADPSVQADILSVLSRLIPHTSTFRHTEGNSDAHAKASLIGSSVTVIIDRSMLVLGTWQGIQFCEFDGPRNRTVWVHLTE